jgi:dihydrofolate reductase/thymidylate synthase
MAPLLHVILAATPEGGVGAAGSLPWRLAPDLAHFRARTLEDSGAAPNVVVVGRRTWDSLPLGRPGASRLPGRAVCVVSATLPEPAAGERHVRVPSLAAALAWAGESGARHVFVAGGAALYAEALGRPDVHTLHLTRVWVPADASVTPVDTWVRGVAPLDEDAFALVAAGPRSTQEGVTFQMLEYRGRAAHGVARSPVWRGPDGAHAAHGARGEAAYLQLLRDVVANGERSGDRTGVGTRALFGVTLRWDLRNNVLPLLTSKRVFWRGVLEELLWFLRGDTDATALASRGVHIWDANGSRAFLDGRGLTRNAEGDLGPVYGFQWRHWGAAYAGAGADYAGQGVDQVAALLSALRGASEAHDAHEAGRGPPPARDRRLLLSAWNVGALTDMALPPCHVLSQWLVGAARARGARPSLTCVLFQRSADLALGVPFNVASYAALTALLAHLARMEPAELVHVMGDAHVYESHVDGVLQQLGRGASLAPPPTLRVDAGVAELEGVAPHHFVVEGYAPAPPIAMPMAV